MLATMQIGALAKRAQCPVETIRFYEREGLLPAPVRSDANYRLYDEAHLERLTFIRYCRSLDMTLDEIRVLLAFRDAPEQNCGQVNALLDEHIGHVAARIAELQGLAEQLKNLRHLCQQDDVAKDCGILNELANEASASSGATKPEGEPESKPRHDHSHIHGAHGTGGTQGSGKSS